MKASELGAKDGDYIVRGNAPFAFRVFDERGFLCANSTLLDGLPGSDWQLLQHCPELGESVQPHDLAEGERCLVLVKNELLPAIRYGVYVGYLHSSGEHDCFGIYASEHSPVYRDPRPLPALPKREPTPKEKCEDILVRNGFGGKSPNFKQAINELAALLENHDE